MALQHLRSSTADKRPTPGAMSDGQLAINTAAASPGLFFKDSGGSLVKVGPVHVGTTAPNASPASGGEAGNTVGEQWLDTSSSTYVFKIWDGSAWRSETGEFVNASGDTMTGALVMDNQQQVRFRETTANGTNYIALQAPASVASDKTITLPDQTGTVLVSGGATIVDADISASAEIAVSKLADGSARQLLQTDAAGTGVEWASNIDVPGTLDVTSTATFDSIISASAGAAATPSITFTGDTNTGIYSPGADQLALATNGTGRLFIDSSGNVDVQAASSTTTRIAGGASVFVRRAETSYASPSAITTGVNIGGIAARGYGGTDYRSVGNLLFASDGAVSDTSSPGYAYISTTPSGSVTPVERLRITSAGLVGVGSSAPGAKIQISDTFASAGTKDYLRLQSESGVDGCVMRISGTAYPGTTQSAIDLIQNAGTNFQSQIAFSTSAGAGAVERVRIDNQGRLGIGTNVVNSLFEVRGTSDGQNIVHLSNNAGASDGAIANKIRFTCNGNTNWANASYDAYGHFWNVAGSEAMRIDGSKRLLVGTSSTGADTRVVISGPTTSGYSAGCLNFHNSSTSPASGDDLGLIQFADANGGNAAFIRAARDGGTWNTSTSRPTRIVFSTTADGASSPTERVRIDNAGNVYLKVMQVGGTANVHWSSSAGQLFVTSSSERFKHDITDYDKGLAELMQMQPKYFVYNDEPNQKQRAGFIAEDFHDLGLTEYVEYWNDDEGNATVPSEIGYANMVAILVKSIQQQQSMIAELQTEVAALKAS